MPDATQVLEPEVKEKILAKIAAKLNSEGELRIVCEEERSQLKNKQKALEKLYTLLSSCFKEKKKRKATKPSKASVKKRLDEKSRQKKTKADRRKPDF
jgi:ribosome-associated protein